MSSTRSTAAAVSAMHMAEATPAERILATREEWIHGRTEAAEFAQGLLLQSLCAALTTKKRPPEGLTEAQVELVRDGGRAILRVAREAMAPLGPVGHLLTAIGGAAHLARPHFPHSMTRWYPCDFPLARLTEDTLQRFVLVEQPVSERMARAALGLAPAPIVYNRVGELYRAIQHGLHLAETRLRGQRQPLFIGPQEAQDADDWPARLHVRHVTDLASAQAAGECLIIAGEGAPANRQGSPYPTLVDMLTAFRRARERAPACDPARPVGLHPATREPRDAGPGCPLLHAGTAAHAVAALCHVVYTTMLLMVMQCYDCGDETPAQRAALPAGIRQARSALMRPLVAVLSALPAGAPAPGRHAGPGFELDGDLRLPSQARSRWVVLLERIRTATVECRRVFTSGREALSRLGFIARNMECLANKIAAVS